jgi:hypothetical protein
MAWIYRDFADGDVNVVLNAIVDFLNSLKHSNLDVKFDASNAKQSPARGIVFYRSGESNKTARETPHAPSDPPTISWNQYTWYTGHDYNYMYDAFNNVLNTGRLPDGKGFLSESQVTNSRVVFTNMHEGDATLSIYYPSV